MVKLSKYQAVLFDLDGVLTPTADIHMQAWSAMFTEVFSARNSSEVPLAPYTEDDYFRYLDGKPRYAGVASLMKSRNITLPWGEADDPATSFSVCGLGNRKNQLFIALLNQHPLLPYPGSQKFLDAVQDAGLKVAVVSSSKNARDVLRSAGILDRFSTIIDGNAVEKGHLHGKPSPDMFLAAAKELAVEPHRAMVLEDAMVGVAAGSAGDFGLVIGVNRGDAEQAKRLAAAGADLVVDDLAELLEDSGAAVTDHGNTVS
ncbi:MAG: beta-phosphoglucomutase family hydrolase [Microbacteriaceae bacterium]